MKKINSFSLLAVLLLSSCSVKLIKNKSQESKTVKKQWIYCTPEDEIKERRAYVKHDDMLCLKDSLDIGLINLSFKQHILNNNTDQFDFIGFNELIVKNKTKILKKIRLEKKGDPFYLITGNRHSKRIDRATALDV